MKNFRIATVDYLTDTARYRVVADGVYENLHHEGEGLLTLEMELEEGDGEQYPLEDILDKYNVAIDHVPDQGEPDSCLRKYVFSGNVADILELKNIVGKRACNKKVTENDGSTAIVLIIE